MRLQLNQRFCLIVALTAWVEPAPAADVQPATGIDIARSGREPYRRPCYGANDDLRRHGSRHGRDTGADGPGRRIAAGTWNVQGQYLVDTISAASRRHRLHGIAALYDEVRQAGTLEAGYKPRDVEVQASAAVSHEPDYLFHRGRREPRVGFPDRRAILRSSAMLWITTRSDARERRSACSRMSSGRTRSPAA